MKAANAKSRTCVSIIFVVGIALFAVLNIMTPAAASRSGFVPPQLNAAGDILFPWNSVAYGIVTLELQLDSNGAITGTNVLRDIPSLTSVAQTAVQSWTFSPATNNGQAVAAPFIVHVIFNTGIVRADDLQVSAPAPFVPIQGLDFAPPQLQSASYADYPVNSVGQGGVVLSVHVNSSGAPTKVRVIHAVPSLTETSVAAAKQTAFTAASYKNSASGADVAIAYVFRTPENNQ